MSMAGTETIVLESFLRAVRRRLWTASLLQSGRTLLWYAGIVLLLLAGVHILITPVATGWILAVVGMPALLLLARVLFRRPSLTQCAAHADREFQGHALMTTAVECLHRSKNADSFAAKAVLRQAENAAQSWSPEVSTRFRQSPGTAATFAIIPLFVALVLLSLPGKENGVQVEPATVGASLPAIVNAGEIVESGADDVAALRRMISDEAAANSQADEEPSATTALAPQQNDGKAELADAPDQFAELAGVAGLPGDDGDLPGNAIARSSSPVDTSTPGVLFSGRENIELQRTANNYSAGTTTGSNYRNSEQRILNSPDIIQAASAPDSLPQSTILSRAQAAHARLYLKESGKTND